MTFIIWKFSVSIPLRIKNSEEAPVQHNKDGILAQNTQSQERKLHLRWLLGVTSIPLFGIVTAFGIAPQTSMQDIAISTVIEEIALPQVAASTPQSNTAEAFWQADLVRKDDTLSSLLTRLNIRNDEAIEFLRHAPEARALASQLRPGRSIQAQTTENGELLALQYQTDMNSVLSIKRTASGYLAENSQMAVEKRSLLKSATISSSLFAATDEANIPDSVAIQLADIFSSDIDFHMDLRKGDRFTVIYEASYNNGELLKTGQVQAAEFVNNGKTYRAVLFRDAEGHTSYYTPEGKSLHKSLLRSPLEFSRITSGFTLARFHPILQTWRAHKGVDYAAPTGTRIRATADGTVAFVGKGNGYGNVIMLEHQNGISTVYGHMSAFASGLRKGMKVTQGEVIGFVGMTGLATGPHLHYEVRVHGEYRDPVKVALPAALPIPAANRAEFDASCTALTAQLDLLRDSHLASLD